jgi:hypothetical protein
MSGRSLFLRLIAALLATTQALAPGVASIVDARPAAQAESIQLAAHVDVPGTKHAIAHPDRCALCGIATRTAAVAPPLPLLPPVVTVAARAHETRTTLHHRLGRWSPPTRAPPRA